MTATPDIFGEATGPTPIGALGQWQFVTNNMNLQFMLAAGLIMPPAGFMDKYYKDTLSDFPGFIPLFLNNVPRTAIESAISERDHLLPCVAHIDLSQFRGPARAIDLQGNTHDVSFPDGALDAEVCCLLIPAPLPINCVQEIFFESGEHKTRFEQGAKDFRNVSLAGFSCKVRASSFKKASAGSWPPEGVAQQEHDTALTAPLAAGAMMALLFHLGGRSDVGIEVAKRAFDPQDATSDQSIDPIVAAVGQWLMSGHAPETDSVSVRLFWGLVDKLAKNNLSSSKSQPLDVALAYLESESDRQDSDRFRQAGAKLIRDLQDVVGFSDNTVTEVLERHTKPFARALILFFLREDLVDLLEFKHPLLEPQDYLAAAILFSARQGWMGVSTDMRQPPALATAVSHRMAAMAHRVTDTGVDLGEAPPRPQTLNELFLRGPSGWTKAQKGAALELAKACKWDCLQTRVTLGKGDYRLSVDGRGMHLILDGLAKAVETEVLEEPFLTLLNQDAIPAKLEQRIREALES